MSSSIRMDITHFTDHLSYTFLNILSGSTILASLIIRPDILFLGVTGASIVVLNTLKMIGQHRRNKLIKLRLEQASKMDPLPKEVADQILSDLED